MNLSDLLASIAVVLNGLPQGLLALTYGFAAFPTTLAFAVGAIGAAIVGSVAPISFQAETIVMAGALGSNRVERLNIVLWTGAVMTVIGLLGLLTPTIDFVGTTILNAMMAGVGIILARVAVDMIKANKTVGGVSLATALLVYVISQDLVYTIVSSVIISSVVSILRHQAEQIDVDFANERFTRTIPNINSRVIRGTLALITLQIGGNIAYGSITGSIAGSAVNIDHLTVYSGIASAVSALFGGGPVEAIISGTGAAPNPLFSGVLMMIIMAAILFFRLLPRLARYVPSQSIAGFLFVLGAMIVFPANMTPALEGNSVIAGVTTVITASTDPFLGMLSGVILRLLLNMVGGM